MYTYDVLYIGNYTKDTIISPSGTRVVDGGSVNYGASAAARLGCRVAVVTRLAKEDARVVERLTAQGVECYPTYTPHSTCLTLEYPTSNPDVRNLSVASTAGAITVEQVEPLNAWAAVIGASFRGEVGLDVIRALKEKGIFLAADMQGYLRVVREGGVVAAPWEEMAETLRHLDVVKCDAVEAELLTGESDRRRSASILAGMGPKEIVLTHQDGVLVLAEGRFYEAGFYPRSLVGCSGRSKPHSVAAGRSGRGDTCIGTYMATRLTRPPEEAMVWAAAVTSLKMEAPGPFDRTIAEVEALIKEKYT
jgi:sugar/nucleoside kinase (ribokinase family)